LSVLDRFRRIERSRREAPRPAADPETAERIEGLERPAPAPTAPAASGADLDRFAPPRQQAQVELQAADDARRPFTRCMRCGMDHNVHVTECTGCGASLDTAAQREFNDRLWRERQAERAAEERLEAEREALRTADAAELAVQRRAMGEALAREVGERERRRLDGEDFAGADVALGSILLGIGAGLGAAWRWLWRLLTRPVEPP
jgi:hypothetical protein